jgi:predicted nucleic acid-binding protein
MRILINDTSCLIDLRKAGLLPVTLGLPYRFVVALPLVDTELLDFSETDWETLKGLGLEVLDLDSEKIGQALRFKATNPRLTANDCFSLVLAAAHQKAILLTGDQALRQVAEGLKVEVHGVLWVIDALDRHGVDPHTLLDGLRRWKDDRLVFLPTAELDRRIGVLRRRLGH